MSKKRDDLIDWTAPVTFCAILRPDNGRPVRDVFKQVWSHSGLSPVGHQHVPWEFPNERRCLWFERYVRRTNTFRSQPEEIIFEIEGFKIRQAVDYLVERDAGTARLEVKGITGFAHCPYLPDKLRAIGRAYAQAGYSYEVISSRWLYARPLSLSVDEIWRARRVRVTPDIRGVILDRLSGGPRPLAELQSLLGPGDPRRILALHSSGDLTIDLTGPIGPTSTVKLGAIDQGPYARSIP
jgi:hypothetical protein